jgi:hypothetical protein
MVAVPGKKTPGKSDLDGQNGSVAGGYMRGNWQTRDFPKRSELRFAARVEAT